MRRHAKVLFAVTALSLLFGSSQAFAAKGLVATLGGASSGTVASTCNAGIAGTNVGQFGAESPLDVAIDGSGNVFEVDLDGRIDSVNGGIRNTFELVPDAPVTEFTLTMKGGKKGLLINSTDLCVGAHRATANFTAQNGKSILLRPPLQSACGAAQRSHKRREAESLDA